MAENNNKQENMTATGKSKQKNLMTLFCSEVALAAVIILLYETNIMLEGGLTGNNSAEFLATTMMELLTIAMIPLALKLFKIEKIAGYIRRKGAEGHYKASVMRMQMIMVPMLINLVLYYGYMNVAFAYLSIILAISLIFIIPTKTRCDSEL
ncbi:MAG: hypothetical protein ACI3Y5_07680 [Prevotella sp.]